MLLVNVTVSLVMKERLAKELCAQTTVTTVVFVLPLQLSLLELLTQFLILMTLGTLRSTWDASVIKVIVDQIAR
jgi:hypothetical protein